MSEKLPLEVCPVKMFSIIGHQRSKLNIEHAPYQRALVLPSQIVSIVAAHFNALQNAGLRV